MGKLVLTTKLTWNNQDVTFPPPRSNKTKLLHNCVSCMILQEFMCISSSSSFYIWFVYMDFNLGTLVGPFEFSSFLPLCRVVFCRISSVTIFLFPACLACTPYCGNPASHAPLTHCALLLPVLCPKLYRWNITILSFENVVFLPSDGFPSFLRIPFPFWVSFFYLFFILFIYLFIYLFIWALFSTKRRHLFLPSSILSVLFESTKKSLCVSPFLCLFFFPGFWHFVWNWLSFVFSFYSFCFCLFICFLAFRACSEQNSIIFRCSFTLFIWFVICNFATSLSTGFIIISTTCNVC